MSTTISLTMLALCTGAVTALSLVATPTPLTRTPTVRMCAGEAGKDVDWREMRARLIAQEKASKVPAATDGSAATDDSAAADGTYVYESPLLEQGTIILGGTKMDYGFALRQQFFHKSVMLLLQHDDSFTKGIILNRPTALELDGWRVWCGHGQVAEGGMFVGAENAMGELEITALHSIEGDARVDELSTRVIKGVSYTSLEGARSLVEAGVAKREDFWVCVGYSGWAPGQLQMEVDDRASWYLASADSGTLLRELLREAKGLPPVGDAAITADAGIETWASLMRGIGREMDVQQSEGGIADRMLREWVRARLLPKPALPTPSTPPPEVGAGTVLCAGVSAATGRPADRVLLQEQFLHKALLLVLPAMGPKATACVLNRPTANLMRFKLRGSPERRVAFCGNREIGEQLWLHHRPELGGVAVGGSGVFMLQADEVAAALQAESAAPSDFLVVGGVVQFERSELAGMLSAGEMRVLPPGSQLCSVWPRVWGLFEEDGGDVSDGTEAWWLASQCGAGDELSAAPAGIADEALGEWLKFFARA